MIDGEIVALDEKGIPCFDGLRSGMHDAHCVVVYYAFDLLYLDGGLHANTFALTQGGSPKLLPKKPTQQIRYIDHIIGDGAPLFAELEKLSL